MRVVKVSKPGGLENLKVLDANHFRDQKALLMELKSFYEPVITRALEKEEKGEEDDEWQVRASVVR